MKVHIKLAYFLAASSSLIISSKLFNISPLFQNLRQTPKLFQPLIANCLKDPPHNMLVEINSSSTNYLVSKLRDAECDSQNFRHISQRLIRILIQEALSQDVYQDKDCTKISLTKAPYHPFQLKYKEQEICIVSIMRSGDSFVDQFMRIVPNCAVGKILLQRQQQRRDKKPQFYYSKLPKSIKSMKRVFLLDPMLGTGGSASMAIQQLKKQGVDEETIVFINMIACPQGLSVIRELYPKIKVVTAIVDQKLNSDCYIVPGLGDFGDRYFGSNL